MATLLARQCLKPSFISTLQSWSVKLKHDAHVVMTDDTMTVVCWHPEESFPYEMSLPIPVKNVPKTDSVLKLQSHKEMYSIFKPKEREIVRRELMALTYTTKHIWFPPKKQFRRKPPPEKSRPYL